MTVSTIKKITSVCIFLSLIVTGCVTPYNTTPVVFPTEDQNSKTETAPILKIGFPPIMPKHAKESGYCCMLMDINTSGTPANIRTSYCTSEIFRKPSLKAATRWKYNPASIDGAPVPTTNHTGYVSFMLSNETGILIHNKKHGMVKNNKRVKSYDKLCLTRQ